MYILIITHVCTVRTLSAHTIYTRFNSARAFHNINILIIKNIAMLATIRYTIGIITF